MSSESPPEAEAPSKHRQRLRPENVRVLAFCVLAVLITLFAVFNLDEVRVHWIVGSGRAPLIIVILISLLVGIVLSNIGQRRRRR